jgi:hypothetical protein
MSLAPDSTDYPAPAAHRARGRVMTPAFWAMMVVAALCLSAAVIVVVGGPRLFRARPTAPREAPASPQISVASRVALPAEATAPALSNGPPNAVAGLDGRVLSLEAHQNRVLDAAGEALAATVLTQAASGPRPFAQTLNQFSRVLAPPQTAVLTPLATQGAPSRTELARQLDDIATRLAVEARAPGRKASLPARLSYALSRLVSIRRLDPNGTGPDALVAQAQIAADSGDIESALTLVSRLPPMSDEALTSWRDGARRRIIIDQAIGALQAQAVSDLAAARVGGP